MLSKFDYVRPKTLDEALAYVEEHGSRVKILAGGTDLLVMLRRNLEMPEHVLDIKAIPETRRLDYTATEGLFIGAAINVNQVAEAAVIREKYPALAQAANTLASYQLRNRATLVGNICNASPGADLSGPLLVYDAQVLIAARDGQRNVPLGEFFTGVKKTVLREGEIVVGVTLPPVAPGDTGVYLKQARLKGHDLGIVGVAVRLDANKKFAVAMSAVAPTPIRLSKLEAMLNAGSAGPELAERAAAEVPNLIKPISDVRASAEYRLHIAGVLVKRAITQLLSGGGN